MRSFKLIPFIFNEFEEDEEERRYRRKNKEEDIVRFVNKGKYYELKPVALPCRQTGAGEKPDELSGSIRGNKLLLCRAHKLEMYWKNTQRIERIDKVEQVV